MTFSAAILSDFPTSSSNYDSKVCSSRLGRNQKRSSFAIPKQKGRFTFNLTVSSVLGNRNPSINDNGAAEPTQILLGRLFSHTQKMEERRNKDSGHTDGNQDGINLANLKSELRAALAVLKKKEEALHDAEMMVLLEHTGLERAKEELVQREKEIAVIAYKQQELDDALKDANLNLESKTTQIEDLKVQVNGKDWCIASAQSVLDSKQRELDVIRNDLVAKNKELNSKNYELATKALLLDEANEVIKKQDVEVQELHKMVYEKQQELEILLELRTRDEEKLKISENNLKNWTMEYVVAHEKVNKIAEDTSWNLRETNATLAEFVRVKRLLTDVRSELVVSQKAISLSREHMKSQELLVEGQLAALKKQKESVVSYFRGLKDAYVEVEGERMQLRVAVDRSKKLEDELSVKKRIIYELEDDLKSEKIRLERVSQEKWILKEELDKKCKELEEARTILQQKDSELLDAKLEIQRLQSQQSLLNQILREKDSELQSASERLKEMTRDVVELKMLLSSKEDKLVQTSNMLKEKDAHLQVMQHELNDSKLKYVDAQNAVQRIVDLTSELIASPKSKCEMEELQLQHSSDAVFSEPKLERTQVEAKMALVREKVRIRELEVLASQRTIVDKNDELNLVREKLNLEEKELNTAKEVIAQETDELKKLHAVAQERIGRKAIGDLANEKIQFEDTQLEAEAATSALTKLAELSRVLLNTPTWFSDTMSTVVLEPAVCSSGNGRSKGESVSDLVDFSGVKTEVARLVLLTEELIHEAG